MVRTHNAKAVWTNDTHLSFSSFAENILFERGSFLANLLEPCRDNDRALDSGSNTFADDTRDSSCGRRNHRQIDFVPYQTMLE